MDKRAKALSFFILLFFASATLFSARASGRLFGQGAGASETLQFVAPANGVPLAAIDSDSKNGFKAQGRSAVILFGFPKIGHLRGFLKAEFIRNKSRRPKCKDKFKSHFISLKTVF